MHRTVSNRYSLHAATNVISAHNFSNRLDYQRVLRQPRCVQLVCFSVAGFEVETVISNRTFRITTVLHFFTSAFNSFQSLSHASIWAGPPKLLRLNFDTLTGVWIFCFSDSWVLVEIYLCWALKKVLSLS